MSHWTLQTAGTPSCAAMRVCRASASSVSPSSGACDVSVSGGVVFSYPPVQSECFRSLVRRGESKAELFPSCLLQMVAETANSLQRSNNQHYQFVQPTAECTKRYALDRWKSMLKKKKRKQKRKMKKMLTVKRLL